MSSTFHTPNAWRTDDAVANLKAIPWAVYATVIDDAARQSRPARAPRRADGYPAATMGAGGGGAELTSVERAADANVFGRVTPEQASLFDLVGEARALLVEASGVASQFEAKIEVIRGLLGQAVIEQRACDLCGATDRTLRFGDVGRRLPVSKLLCAVGATGPSCYDVVVRNDGWPSEEQQAQFERTGRWRYRQAS